MLPLLRKLRDWIEDARLRRAAQRYQAQLKVIDGLALPEEFKQAAREQALNRVGRDVEQYLTRP